MNDQTDSDRAVSREEDNRIQYPIAIVSFQKPNTQYLIAIVKTQ